MVPLFRPLAKLSSYQPPELKERIRKTQTVGTNDSELSQDSAILVMSHRKAQGFAQC